MEEIRKKRSRKRKMIEKLLFLIIIILAVFAIFTVIKNSGWRINLSMKKINFQKYDHIGPNFSFRYPDYFRLDKDEEKKFGKEYIAGFKLKTDQRTGCDVRFSSVGLNFEKTDQEIEDAIKNDLAKNVKEFNLINSQRIKFNKDNAFLINFSFLDPIGNMAKISQILTTHDNTNYILICGTGEYQYQFFQKDFQNFFDTFKWNK